MTLPIQGAPSATTCPWDCQPDESAKAYAAFCLYRDLSPGRRSIHEAFRRSPDAKTSPKNRTEATRASRAWQRWCSSHAWVTRAAAWDIHHQRLATEAHERETTARADLLAKRRRDIREIEYAGAVTLLKRVITELDERGTYAGMGANLEAASRTARLALDMPTKVEVTGSVQDFRQLMFASAGEMAAAIPEAAAQPMPANVLKTPAELGVTGSCSGGGQRAPQQGRPKRPGLDIE